MNVGAFTWEVKDARDLTSLILAIGYPAVPLFLFSLILPCCAEFFFFLRLPCCALFLCTHSRYAYLL